MLTVYPSNRLEDLAILLQALLERSGASVLESQLLLVESQGMKHWISLQLASLQGIAMNLNFPMPQRFIWEQARQVLGDDKVPKDSPYKREVLAWRIDQLLSSEAFIRSEQASSVNQYWNGDRADQLKRFQLAAKVGDLFEQYMMFRPQWLLAWEQQKSIAEEYGLDPEIEQWQAWLWCALVEQQAMHPVLLQQQALALLAKQAPDDLPQHIFIFAINTLAPQSLAFIDAIAKHCQVHLFHLNPCANFWGDIQSDKHIAQQLRQQRVAQWNDAAGLRNPLLANLGQQGRDFFNLLQQVDSYEISAFCDDHYQANKHQPSLSENSTVLAKVQQDILQLRHAAQTPIDQFDESIILSSSHSALREIQALHDYLLHQFNDPQQRLKPQDILVMCPAIEDYAPYIEAVFRRPWEDDDAQAPKLPCSIADRSLRDSEPLITVFLSLLDLPDSRFELSKISDYLRLPAIQNKFSLATQDLETIEWWLQQAGVHWGLNAQHKQQVADLSSCSDMFSWEWGLKRLILGYAQGDEFSVHDELLLLPHVEGQQALLLGRLMQLLETLQQHRRRLATARGVSQWQSYLLELCDSLFEADQVDENALQQIQDVIAKFVEHCSQAEYQQDISLEVVRHYLNHHFSLPDAVNHFMTGQVTFCSMMPMRSIPFQLIAVLGLNDGQFPRQNTPISFDLMSQSLPQQGDRSRRGDDRYLFLEAIISARSTLYLSYQGRAIKDNAIRQPSLILRELMNYLSEGYGWTFKGDGSTKDGLRQQALHPFSADNFKGSEPSFDGAWLRLVHASEERNNLISLSVDPEMTKELSLLNLCRMFNDPLEQFSRQSLQLNLRSQYQLLDDAEPFSADGLLRYQLNQDFTTALVKGEDLSTLETQYRLSGKLPDSMVAEQELNLATAQAGDLYQALSRYGELHTEPFELKFDDWIISGEYLVNEQGQVVLYRSAGRRAVDDLVLYLLHLLLSVSQQQVISLHGLFLENVYNSDLKHVKTVELCSSLSLQDCEQQLSLYLNAYQQGLLAPQLWHAVLGKKLFEKRAGKLTSPVEVDPEFSQSWQQQLDDPNDLRSLTKNPYFTWFYPIAPSLDDNILGHLTALYLPLYQALKVLK